MTKASMTMTDCDHLKLALEHGDEMVAHLMVLDMRCEAEDVRQVLKGIRADMDDELGSARERAAG